MPPRAAMPAAHARRATIRHTTAICLAFGALLAGVALGRAGLTAPAPWLAAVATAALLAGLVRRRFLVLGLVIALGALGLWRAQAAAADHAALLGQVGRTVTLTGLVADDPSLNPRGYLDFHVDHLRESAGPPTGPLTGPATTAPAAGPIANAATPIPGQVRVRLYPINLHRGYQVQLTGKLRPPYYSGPVELSYPQLTVVSTHQSWLERVRQRFFVGMKTALAEPMASFGLGLLVGVRALIPKPLQDQLALVGLSHLVAVSGYNLTIIVLAAHKILARFGRGIALAGSLWLIAGFLVVTGASASIVRASLVAVLALLATFYGRRFHPPALILIAAGVTAAYQPDYPTDLGWLLSFLAFYGILVLAPAVEARLGHPKRLIVKLFIETTAAQLMTIPLILYYFGQLSIVAPITNLIELPLVPLAMLLSFIAGLAGMLTPAFAGWLAWPADLLLRFLLGAVDFFARQPWAGTTFQINLPVMLGLYALIVLATTALQRAPSTRATTSKPADLALIR